MKIKHHHSSFFRLTSTVLTVCMLFIGFAFPVIALDKDSLSAGGNETDNSSVGSLTTEKVALKADDVGVKDSKFITYIGKEAFEAAGHVKRVPELEDLGTYVFDNLDGTRTVYYDPLIDYAYYFPECDKC